jgi:ribosomal protein S18 acetylase RimI-like enzyme
MLDKSIPYYQVIMKREKGLPLSGYLLPDDFKFILYKDGDEREWAEIETSVGEFKKVDDALEYFQREFLPHKTETERRCLFIENSSGEKVATLTTWWGYTGQRRDPRMHWAAVRPEYQGLGLGKALVCEGLRRLVVIEGDKDVYLSTQTWSYKAINIYRNAGFIIAQEKGLLGFDNADFEKAVKILENYLR